MEQPQLVAPVTSEACAHCAASIPAGAQAWWDDDGRLWTCTACVPPDEATRHSVGYAFAPKERSKLGRVF